MSRTSDEFVDVIDAVSQPLLTLDSTLRVRRANAAFLRSFALTMAEIDGRPLIEIGDGRWDDPELQRRLELVARGAGRLKAFRLEQPQEDRRRRVLQIDAGRLDGRREDGEYGSILLTIGDVTERERLRFDLEGRIEFAEKLIDSVRDALLVLSSDLRVVTANGVFYEMFRVAPARTEGRLVYALGNRQWDIPELRRLLEDILPKSRTFDDFEVEHDFEDIGPRTMLLNGRRIDHENLILLTISDVTTSRRADRDRLRAETLQNVLVELADRLRNVSDPIAVMTCAGELIGRHIQAHRVAYTEIDADGEYATVSPDWNDGGLESVAGRHRLIDLGPVLLAALRQGTTLAVDDVTEDPRTSAAETLAAFARAGVGAFLAVPLIKEGRFIAALLVWEKGPRQWKPAEVATVEQVAERTWSAVEAARAEQLLRESEEKYRTLFNSIDEGFCIIETFEDENSGRLDYRFIEVNAAFERQSGLTAARGESMRMLAPDHEEHWFDMYERIARTGRPERFEAPAVALGRHFDVYAFRTGRPEQRRVAILFNEISDRKRQEAQIRLLMREVNHRSKNMLSIVQAVARRTAATGYENFVERFEQRIHALASNQDLLVKSEWQGVDLEELVRAQLAHFDDLIDSRIRLRGPAVTLASAASQTIGMALHELATNGGKYGALSTDSGRIEIEWTLWDDAFGTRRFMLGWTEYGGPPVTPPSRRGFGSVVVVDMVRMNLDADVTLEYAPTGLVWRLRCPLAQVAEERLPGN